MVTGCAGVRRLAHLVLGQTQQQRPVRLVRILTQMPGLVQTLLISHGEQAFFSSQLQVIGQLAEHGMDAQLHQELLQGRLCHHMPLTVLPHK